MTATGPSNPNTRALIRLMRHNKDSPLWRRMANEIEAPRRSHTTINVDELSRVVKNDQTVVVPGKVLGNGTIDKKVRISALQFSESAKVKISASGGTVVSMEQLLTENPKGSGITLIKGAQKRC